MYRTITGLVAFLVVAVVIVVTLEDDDVDDNNVGPMGIPDNGEFLR